MERVAEVLECGAERPSVQQRTWEGWLRWRSCEQLCPGPGQNQGRRDWRGAGGDMWATGIKFSPWRGVRPGAPLPALSSLSPWLLSTWREFGLLSFGRIHTPPCRLFSRRWPRASGCEYPQGPWRLFHSLQMKAAVQRAEPWPQRPVTVRFSADTRAGRSVNDSPG